MPGIFVIFAVLMKDRSIPDILNGFQKVELEDLGSILGNNLSHRLRKTEQVKAMTEYLTRQPRRWLSHLLERDIRLLRHLVHSGPGKVQYIERADYPSLLEVSGLVDSDDSDDRYLKVWVRREVYDIVAPYIDQEIKRGEKSGRFEIERVGFGYLNLYGIISVEHFINLMMDYYEGAHGSDFNELVSLLQLTPLMKVHRFTDEHGDYLVSPCLGDAEEVFQVRKEVYPDGETYKPFTAEEALEAGNGAPYFTVGLNTPEGRALTDALQRIGYAGFDLVKAQHDIWVEAQVPYENEALFTPLNSKEDSVSSDALYFSCLTAIIDFANAVPKWALNGFSALEKDCLVLEHPSETPVQETESSGEDYPQWTMPHPTISEGYTDLIEKDGALERLAPLMPEGFPFGLAIPHVAPSDPCPCGSGLRYGNCHGKNLN